MTDHMNNDGRRCNCQHELGQTCSLCYVDVVMSLAAQRDALRNVAETAQRLRAVCPPWSGEAFDRLHDLYEAMTAAGYQAPMSDGSNDSSRAEVYRLIDDERARQQRLFGDRSIAGELPPDTKLRVLVEEVGEVARALDVLEQVRAGHPDLADGGYTLEDAIAHLREELVQVGACAVGWLEALGRQR